MKKRRGFHHPCSPPVSGECAKNLFVRLVLDKMSESASRCDDKNGARARAA
jgi:hypothetical protein